METMDAEEAKKYPLLSKISFFPHEDHQELSRRIVLDNAIRATLLIPNHGTYFVKEYCQPELAVLPYLQEVFNQGQSITVRELLKRYQAATGEDLRRNLEGITASEEFHGTAMKNPLQRVLSKFVYDGIAVLHRRLFLSTRIDEGRCYDKIHVVNASVVNPAEKQQANSNVKMLRRQVR